MHNSRAVCTTSKLCITSFVDVKFEWTNPMFYEYVIEVFAGLRSKCSNPKCVSGRGFWDSALGACSVSPS
jgi:hypothetical protein